GHDLNYISRAGVASLSGIGGVPVMPGVQLADMMGAHQAAIGVLAADIHRRQSGEGQFIDISLMESTFTMASIYASGRLSGCSPPEMEKLPLTGKFPHYRFYRCADGQYLAVAALEERFQRRLSASLGVELAFDTLEALFATRSRDDWYQALQDIDACVEPVLSLDEVLKDPHLLARRPVIEVGGFSQPAPAIRFSQTPCTEHTPAPAVGEHNQDLQI
ncbi:MAG TPA: CoA transferase, partial [Candidatus Obscuribacterales bacterium]